MSAVTSILFLGAWMSFIDIAIFNMIPGTINFALKTMIFISMFIIVRGILPRYRYDQLMRLGWKVFLPFSLALAVIFGALMISFNCSPENLR
jgi:NADH-quinone oxidoreductase subunit H